MSHAGVKVDVLLVTYNHAEYIRCALDSIFGQVYADGFRVVVADDCSSDSTVAIIQEYARRHPEVELVFLDNTRNLGITKNYQRAFAACRAEYVAVLEGDDFWSSTEKLRKQAGFLDQHRECSMCACNYWMRDLARASSALAIQSQEGFTLHDSRALILDYRIGTFSACLYRREELEAIPPILYEMKTYDWAVNICLGMRGRVGFLHEPLVVYNIHDGGAWSSLSEVEKIQEQLALIPGYDRATEGIFHQEFEELKRRLGLSLPPASRSRLSAALNRGKVWLLHLCPPFLIGILRAMLPPTILNAARRMMRSLNR